MIKLWHVQLQPRGKRRRLTAVVAAVVTALITSVLYLVPVTPAAALTGSVRLHDPDVIKVGNCYYGFSTGFANDPANPNGQILEYRSCGSAVGPWSRLGTVFNQTPAWVTQRIGVSNFGNVWSPYVRYFNNQFHLYYAVATSTPSWKAVMGLATATNIEGPWTDAGFVTDVDFPIDPNVDVGLDGRLHIEWGSFGGVYQQWEIV